MAAVLGIPGRTRPLVLLAVQTLSVAAGYYAAGRLGLLRRLVAEEAVVSPVWPPTGVALACLLVLGPRCVPGIALGALLVVASLGPLRPATAGVVLGNTAGPVCAYLMLRAAGFRTDLGKLRDGVLLVFLGALTGMLVSATAGAGLLALTGKLDPAGLPLVWLAWWVGDAMGVVIVTPLLLLLYGARRAPPRPARWGEAAGLTVIAGVLVPVATRSSVSVLFLVFPLLVWAALRFRFAGSMLCALFASVLATVAATDRTGPFAGLSEVEVMIKLQAFNGTMALTALLLSALITEQRNTRRSVEEACQELVEALEHLTAGDPPPRRPAGGDPDGPP
ncbi:MASE1 domain-containing protein [Streptomyces fumanus]|uniref:Membrane protein n=1 Tax=Streptomyces fumanus TaxID=67302 RepID=A0A919AAA5_9ACTN|nr:MASE1 domain-containing protein [Streptomyces fumanus]GHE94417.1 membrane protein [Streptomyces fumanus]